jgi:uncharacterized protein YgiB involved in biofilm formation
MWAPSLVTFLQSLMFNQITTFFESSIVSINNMYIVATPLWAKCEGEAHTPKSGKLESSGTPKNSELD